MQTIPNLSKNPARDKGFPIRQLHRVEDANRLGNRKVHVFRYRAPLHADRAALGLQAFAVAGGTGPQRAIRLQVLLLEPGPLVVTPPKVRNEPFEPGAEWILIPSTPLARHVFGTTRRAVEQQITNFSRQSAERKVEVDSKRAAQRIERLADQLSIPFGPRSNRAALERHRFIGNEACRVEIIHGAEPLTARAGSVRRVERERTRRHFRHAHTAVGARQTPRE